MYRDKGIVDKFESLFSAPKLTVRRFRMRKTKLLHDMQTQKNESLIVSLKGEAEVNEYTTSRVMKLRPIDICYLPPHCRFSIRKIGSNCDVIWALAPARKSFAPYLRRFQDCKPKEFGSKANSSYRLNTTIITFDKKERSERLRAGFTQAGKGNWTSFPPHRHDGVPEIYIFTGFKRGFGLQMAWTEQKEIAYLVRDGDAVGFNEGYHPNVGDPTTKLKFLWIMSSDLSTSSKLHPEFRNVGV